MCPVRVKNDGSLNSSNSSSGSAHSPIKDKDSTRRKLKKLKHESSATDDVFKVCEAALNDLKENERKIMLLQHDVSKLEAEKQKFIDDLILEAQKTQHEKDAKDALALQLMVAKAELNARPYVELLQRKVMPGWLLNDDDLTAESKWESALKFNLSRTARILLHRLTLVPHVEVSVVAELLARSYDVFPEVLEHKKKVSPLVLTSEAWDAFFDKVGITDPVQQDAFKLLMQPFRREDYAQVGLLPNCGNEKYVFLVKYLNINLRQNGEYETSRQLQGVYPTWNLENFYYPRDTKGNYTNIVIFISESCTSKDAYKLAEELKKSPRPGCHVNVKCDVYNPNK